MALESRNENYNEELQLKDYLEATERLHELKPDDIRRLLERAEAMMLEVSTPDGKDRYVRFIQAAKISLASEFSHTHDSRSSIQVEDTYEITFAGEKRILQTTVDESHQWSDLTQLDIPIGQIDIAQSKAFTIFATAENQQFFINVRLFHVIEKPDKIEKKYLYIADRYVAPKLRGNAIGGQLLHIADTIAKINNCELIFGNLISEDPQDIGILKKGHEKAGYEIVGKDHKTIAIKKIK